MSFDPASRLEKLLEVFWNSLPSIILRIVFIQETASKSFQGLALLLTSLNYITNIAYQRTVCDVRFVSKFASRELGVSLDMKAFESIPQSPTNKIFLNFIVASVLVFGFGQLVTFVRGRLLKNKYRPVVASLQPTLIANKKDIMKNLTVVDIEKPSPEPVHTNAVDGTGTQQELDLKQALEEPYASGIDRHHTDIGECTVVCISEQSANNDVRQEKRLRMLESNSSAFNNRQVNKIIPESELSMPKYQKNKKRHPVNLEPIDEEHHSPPASQVSEFSKRKTRVNPKLFINSKDPQYQAYKHGIEKWSPTTTPRNASALSR